MKKICCVVQRYGEEVNGGAEYLTREFAERLAPFYDVEVLTTKSIDYQTWRNEYENDEETINGVHVLRFPTEKDKDKVAFDDINSKYINRTMKSYEQERWIYEQGPFVPRLVQYLKAHKDEYSAILLFTYLYYPSVKCVSIAPEKTIVIPFAHDEVYLNMPIFRNLFEKPKALVFETEEEKELIHSRFDSKDIPYTMAGSGVEITTPIDVEGFKKKYGLDDYIVYVGRIDYGKNCDELLGYFSKYKKKNPSNLKLVLVGKEVMEVNKSSDVVSLGFVSQEDKYNAIAGAKALVLPSKFESLSIVVLEAFELDVPVIVNGECEVLKGHISRSDGGFAYFDYAEFENAINSFINDEEMRIDKGHKGKEYITKNYQWDKIIENLRYVIDMDNGGA